MSNCVKIQINNENYSCTNSLHSKKKLTTKAHQNIEPTKIINLIAILPKCQKVSKSSLKMERKQRGSLEQHLL